MSKTNVFKKVSKSRKNKLNKGNFDELIKKLQCKEQEIDKCENSNVKKLLETQHAELTNALEEHVKYKAKGAQIRSKCTWVNKGEMNTNFFLGLERVKCSNKTLKAVLCEDNSITRDQKKILNEQRKFYQKLYTQDPNVVFTYVNEVHKKHSEIDKKELDKEFTYDEFKTALKGMANDKSPGMDGLPCEFYKMFFTKLGHILWEAVIYSHEQGILHHSA